MSDESPPPSLRLRPRKRDDEPAPAVGASVNPPAAVVPAVLDAPAESPARFRLKPKLTSEPEVKNESKDPAPAPVLPPVPASEPPPVFLPSDEAGIPRLKLKPLTGESADVPPAPPPSRYAPGSGGDAASIQLPPNIPGSMMVGGLPPVVVAKPVAPPPVPHSGLTIKAPLPPVMPPPKAPPKTQANAPAKKKKTKVVLAALVALLILGGGGGYYFYVMRLADSETDLVRRPSKPVKAASSAGGRGDAPATGSPGGTRIAPLPPQPSLSQPASRPGKPPQPTGPTNAALAAALKAWINDARITGVVGGASPKAIINNRVVRPGEMLDASKGIIFDSIDTERKLVIFRTAEGLFGEKAY